MNNLQGYLAIAKEAGDPYTEYINNCRTLGYISQLSNFHQIVNIDGNPDSYTFPDSAWRLGGGEQECSEACSDCFSHESGDFVDPAVSYTYPADPLNPAPWYDANTPSSTEFFGFMVRKFTMTKGYGTKDRSPLVRRQRTNKKRLGTIEGWIVSNSCSGTEFGIGWMTSELSPEGEDCSGGGWDTSVHKQSCNCDNANPRLNGWRTLKNVGGFDIQVHDEEPDGRCIPCCQGAYVSITFEVENPKMFLTPEVVDTVDTSVAIPACECNIFQYTGDCCTDTAAVVTSRNRRTRSVRALKDRTLCPIGWDAADYDATTDQFVLGGFEYVPATAGATLYVSLQQDVSTAVVTAHDPVTGDLINIDDVECGREIEVIELQYVNESYDPTCVECPGAQLACAADAGLAVDGFGIIDWAGSTPVISEGTTYTFNDGDSITTADALGTLEAYWNCIQQTAVSGAIGTQYLGNFQALLDLFITQYNSEFGGIYPPTKLLITIDGVGGDTYVKAASSISGSNAVNVDYQFILPSWPGWVDGIGSDISCGQTIVPPDFCQEILTVSVPNGSKPLTTEVVLEPVTGVASFDSNILGGFYSETLVGTYNIENPNCATCIDPTGNLEIVPFDNEDGTFSWQENGWTLQDFQAFPPEDAVISMVTQENLFQEITTVCDPGDCGADPGEGCQGTEVPDTDFVLNDIECQTCEPLNVRRYFTLIPPDSLALPSVPVVTVTANVTNGLLPWVKVIAVRDRPELTAVSAGPDNDWENWEALGGHTTLAMAEEANATIEIDGCADTIRAICALDTTREEEIVTDGEIPVISRVGTWIGIFLPCDTDDARDVTATISRVGYESH